MQRTQISLLLVLACMYRCRQVEDNPVPSNTSELLKHMCNGTTDEINGVQNWNRDGQLCGKCHESFAPPAYSYDWRCINCSQKKHSVINSIIKYCVIAFLRLTGFFIMLVTLRISVTSPSVNAFVLACQVLTIPLQVRIFLSTVPIRHFRLMILLYRVIVSLYGFWNLDFFSAHYIHYFV